MRALTSSLQPSRNRGSPFHYYFCFLNTVLTIKIFQPHKLLSSVVYIQRVHCEKIYERKSSVPRTWLIQILTWKQFQAWLLEQFFIKKFVSWIQFSHFHWLKFGFLVYSHGAKRGVRELTRFYSWLVLQIELLNWASAGCYSGCSNQTECLTKLWAQHLIFILA